MFSFCCTAIWSAVWKGCVGERALGEPPRISKSGSLKAAVVVVLRISSSLGTLVLLSPSLFFMLSITQIDGLMREHASE